MAKTTGKAPKKRAPALIADPVAFWKAQHAQATLDAEAARDKSPSVLPKLVALQREAWREYKTALASAETEGGKPKPAAPAAPAPPAPGSLEEELGEVRRMRRQAQEAQKLTSAEKLLRRESELLEAIRVRDEAAKKKARGAMTPEQLADALVARVRQMPAGTQERIRRELGWA